MVLAVLPFVLFVFVLGFWPSRWFERLGGQVSTQDGLT
jgi:hypothetical protein